MRVSPGSFSGEPRLVTATTCIRIARLLYVGQLHQVALIKLGMRPMPTAEARSCKSSLSPCTIRRVLSEKRLHRGCSNVSQLCNISFNFERRTEHVCMTQVLNRLVKDGTLATPGSRPAPTARRLFPKRRLRCPRALAAPACPAGTRRRRTRRPAAPRTAALPPGETVEVQVSVRMSRC